MTSSHLVEAERKAAALLGVRVVAARGSQALDVPPAAVAHLEAGLVAVGREERPALVLGADGDGRRGACRTRALLSQSMRGSPVVSRV